MVVVILCCLASPVTGAAAKLQPKEAYRGFMAACFCFGVVVIIGSISVLTAEDPVCWNTAVSLDAEGNGCAWYADNPDTLACDNINYQTDTFRAPEHCCACGGGQDTSFGSTTTDQTTSTSNSPHPAGNTISVTANLLGLA